MIKSGLKLLVAMVMLGVPAGKLVLDNVDLALPGITALWKRRDTKDEEDVRTCFTHLVIAFLLIGDGDLIRRLIQVKGIECQTTLTNYSSCLFHVGFNIFISNLKRGKC